MSLVRKVIFVLLDLRILPRIDVQLVHTRMNFTRYSLRIVRCVRQDMPVRWGRAEVYRLGCLVLLGIIVLELRLLVTALDSLSEHPLSCLLRVQLSSPVQLVPLVIILDCVQPVNALFVRMERFVMEDKLPRAVLVLLGIFVLKEALCRMRHKIDVLLELTVTEQICFGLINVLHVLLVPTALLALYLQSYVLQDHILLSIGLDCKDHHRIQMLVLVSFALLGVIVLKVQSLPSLVGEETSRQTVLKIHVLSALLDGFALLNALQNPRCNLLCVEQAYFVLQERTRNLILLRLPVSLVITVQLEQLHRNHVPLVVTIRTLEEKVRVNVYPALPDFIVLEVARILQGRVRLVTIALEAVQLLPSFHVLLGTIALTLEDRVNKDVLFAHVDRIVLKPLSTRFHALEVSTV